MPLIKHRLAHLDAAICSFAENALRAHPDSLFTDLGFPSRGFGAVLSFTSGTASSTASSVRAFPCGGVLRTDFASRASCSGLGLRGFVFGVPERFVGGGLAWIVSAARMLGVAFDWIGVFGALRSGVGRTSFVGAAVVGAGVASFLGPGESSRVSESPALAAKGVFA